jgi:hypothetical protein
MTIMKLMHKIVPVEESVYERVLNHNPTPLPRERFAKWWTDLTNHLRWEVVERYYGTKVRRYIHLSVAVEKFTNSPSGRGTDSLNLRDPTFALALGMFGNSSAHAMDAPTLAKGQLIFSGWREQINSVEYCSVLAWTKFGSNGKFEVAIRNVNRNSTAKERATHIALAMHDLAANIRKRERLEQGNVNA